MFKGRSVKRAKILVFVWLLVLNMFCTAENENETGILYILLWTHGGQDPFNFWPRGRKSLITMNCKFQNCYFTDNHSYFKNPIKYDAILFNAPGIHSDMLLPSTRSEEQIYVFVSTESESNYPIPNKFNNFFNYTWSYKLNSDIQYPYFYARDKFNGTVIAPQMTVHWRNPNNMQPTPISVIEQLQNKSICAAWFVSNCQANNRRLDYVRQLRIHLQNLNQQIDIFGICDANKQCSRSNLDDCYELVKANYYFYLSFENTFSEDYVTEKILTALNNYAIPVVFGGANYSRFLPDGAYLNAREYSPQNLADKMNYIMMNRQEYYDYFKFYRYYSYHTIGESEDIDPLCTFCKFINSDSRLRIDPHTYPLFSHWWNSNSSPSIENTKETSSEDLVTDFPEWLAPPLESDDNNIAIDIINYYFKGTK